MTIDRYDRAKFRRLLTRISRLRRRLVEYPHWSKIDFTIDEARDFINAGEEGLAFELLADNLYEYEFPLSCELYSEFQAIGATVGIPYNRWNFLEKLVTE